MKILALDSSGLVASAAVVEDDVLIAEYTTDYKKTHSQTLLPMLDEIRGSRSLIIRTSSFKFLMMPMFSPRKKYRE